MHCLCRACGKQLWRVAEWLVRKRTLVPKIKAARVVEGEVAAVAVQAAEEVAAWAAVDLPAAKAVAEVDAQVVAAADKVAAVVAVLRVAAVVDKVVVAVVDVLPAVVGADKV